MSVEPVRCGECGAPVKLRETSRKFYGCIRFPTCKGSLGTYPDGRPLDVPADTATKAARIKAHEVFDELWKRGHMKRRAAYIGKFDVKMCERLVKEASELLRARDAALQRELNR